MINQNVVVLVACSFRIFSGFALQQGERTADKISVGDGTHTSKPGTNPAAATRNWSAKGLRCRFFFIVVFAI
jgi:hypothetical protein